MLSDWPENQIAPWLYSREMVRRFSIVSLRWIRGALFLVGVLIGLGLFGLGRKLCPTWLKTIFLAWLALLALSGPLWEFSWLGADLFSPSEGFWPNPTSTLHREACLLMACWPIGLYFGVPVVGAWSSGSPAGSGRGPSG